jgi:tRNA dimethylallyltransferase
VISLVTILGPTACGKTALAAALAARIGAEIISADSRQVYRGMTIGTGKDLADYTVDGHTVPCHLIDICEPGYRYSVFEYQRDFHRAYAGIQERGKQVILCGGTGLYIESVLKGYRLPPAPENPELRRSLQDKTSEELAAILASYKTMHNTTDIDSPRRTIRAIEIAEFSRTQPAEKPGSREYAPMDSLIVGVSIDRELRRRKITDRLKKRLDEGMLDEIKTLLSSGVSPEDLIYYGLEYKFLTLHLLGQLTFDEMFSQLEIAIHQFAKRQMTWFRGMERRGFTIRWVDASQPMTEKVETVLRLLAEETPPAVFTVTA